MNRSIDLRRRVRREPFGVGGAPAADPEARDPLAEAPSGDPGPAASARSAERAAIVRAAIARLSPKLATIVLLRYAEGLSYEEVGELLRLRPGTVRSRLNRAHAALRKTLGDALDEVGPTENG